MLEEREEQAQQQYNAMSPSQKKGRPFASGTNGQLLRRYKQKLQHVAKVLSKLEETTNVRIADEGEVIALMHAIVLIDNANKLRLLNFYERDWEDAGNNDEYSLLYPPYHTMYRVAVRLHQ